MSEFIMPKHSIRVIEQKQVVEYLHWDCPNCKSRNKSSEFVIENSELFCNSCHKFIKYTSESFE